MARKKKDSKLTFIPLNDHLKELTANTIPQVTTALSYVSKWGNSKIVKESLPEDHKNVLSFFKDIKKLSPQGFQPKKFKDLWDKYDMQEITDYELEALGVAKKINKEEEEDY